jgi:LuxR family maltose regulon positive regulatory protein
VQRKLILVSAPAGFGKTTLLNAWATHALSDHKRHAGDMRFAWLSLEREDNVPVRFWSYFIHALQRAVPGHGATALSMLETSERLDIERTLTVLLNALATLKTPLTLILDDYHLIHAPTIHNGLRFLIEHLPPHFHLALATRVDPPWPLARWRAQQWLLEVRQDDLCFSLEEAVDFLRSSMHLSLTQEQVAALDAHTEGWIVGLQMTALSLQRQPDTPGFIAAFTDSHRYVFDYLLEEVLQQQRAMVQEFLLCTAFLERLSPVLCDTILERDDSSAILAELDRANLFLTPLDSERRWYRYHPLFAQLLRRQGEQLHIDLVPLQRRASVWFEEHARPTRALDLALQISDTERAARIAEEHALILLGQGHLGTLSAWLDALPETLTAGRPWLCVTRAWLAVYAGRLEATERWLVQAEGLLHRSPYRESVDARRIAGHIATIRSYVLGLSGAHQRIAPLARAALEQLPLEDRMGRVMAHTLLAIGLRHAGALNEAEDALQQAIALTQGQGRNQAVLFARTTLAALHLWRGQLKRAGEAYAQLIGDAGAFPASMVAAAYLALSRIRREENALDEALCLARQGLALAQQWGHGEFVISGHIDLAEVLLAQGDGEGALTSMARARELRGEIAWPTWLDALEVKLQAGVGDTEALVAWTHDFEIRTRTPELHLQHTALYLALARAYLVEERADEALDVLQRIWEVVSSTEVLARKLETQVLSALAYAAVRRPGAAREALEEALALAEPEEYVRIFLDEGPAIVELLQAIPLHSPWRGYARHLLAEYARTDATKYPTQLVEMVEPLSARELEVLQLLATSMDSRAMAEQLTIAVSTLRTHVRNIYAKLGVNRRLEAVARAKELGLL